jgi:hypothetical protein
MELLSRDPFSKNPSMSRSLRVARPCRGGGRADPAGLNRTKPGPTEMRRCFVSDLCSSGWGLFTLPDQTPQSTTCSGGTIGTGSEAMTLNLVGMFFDKLQAHRTRPTGLSSAGSVQQNPTPQEKAQRENMLTKRPKTPAFSFVGSVKQKCWADTP